jgi:hypothetical protein
MIFAMKCIANNDYPDDDNDERVENGLKRFAEHFEELCGW